MDPADAFLHRKEAKAIRRRIKEPLQVVAPVHCKDKDGLLAVTSKRVLFAHRKALGVAVDEWPRRTIGGVRVDKRRYGIVQIRIGKRVIAFDTTRKGDADRIHLALVPKATQPTSTVEAIRRPTRPDAPDPLAHRGTPAHIAKLEDMVARGLMTKKELDWQLGR